MPRDAHSPIKAVLSDACAAPGRPLAAAAAAAPAARVHAPEKAPRSQARVPEQAAAARGDNRGLVSMLTLLLAISVLLGRSGWFRSGDAWGYNMGLAGGLMMLVLLLYPVRKRLKFARNWGASRFWFMGHMILGVAGPLLILVHSTYHLGSTNAAVALVSMLLVAGSGVMGRYIYVRIHRGLYGERSSLREMQRQMGLNSSDVHSKLGFAPEIERMVADFEARAMPEFRSLLHDGWRFATLGVRRQWIYLHCRAELDHALRREARQRGWDAGKLRRRRVAIGGLIRNYLANVQRIGQFAVYEKLFSLWHVLHTPLVYLLVLSGIAHVVAVHMY